MNGTESIRDWIKRLIYDLWVLYGFVGPRSTSNLHHTVTVLITYYNPARFRHINHQLRNMLKCDFVERIVISNHNPEIRIDDFVKVSDPRLVVVNQSVRQGCGYRWHVAHQFSPDYLIVLDDDILLFPWQVKKLFASLIAEPEVPHGLAGMVREEKNYLQYHQREDLPVDYICEVYAITNAHLDRYLYLRDQIEATTELTESIESATDFIVISRAGSLKPKIHSVGYLVRCPTFNTIGVALHKEGAFFGRIKATALALDAYEQDQAH